MSSKVSFRGGVDDEPFYFELFLGADIPTPTLQLKSQPSKDANDFDMYTDKDGFDALASAFDALASHLILLDFHGGEYSASPYRRMRIFDKRAGCIYDIVVSNPNPTPVAVPETRFNLRYLLKKIKGIASDDSDLDADWVTRLGASFESAVRHDQERGSQTVLVTLLEVWLGFSVEKRTLFSKLLISGSSGCKDAIPGPTLADFNMASSLLNAVLTEQEKDSGSVPHSDPLDARMPLDDASWVRLLSVNKTVYEGMKPCLSIDLRLRVEAAAYDRLYQHRVASGGLTLGHAFLGQILRARIGHFLRNNGLTASMAWGVKCLLAGERPIAEGELVATEARTMVTQYCQYHLPLEFLTYPLASWEELFRVLSIFQTVFAPLSFSREFFDKHSAYASLQDVSEEGVRRFCKPQLIQVLLLMVDLNLTYNTSLARDSDHDIFHNLKKELGLLFLARHVSMSAQRKECTLDKIFQKEIVFNVDSAAAFLGDIFFVFLDKKDLIGCDLNNPHAMLALKQTLLLEIYREVCESLALAVSLWTQLSRSFPMAASLPGMDQVKCGAR